MTTITYEDFERVNLRSGTVIKVEEFPKARKPAFKVWADFGADIGILQTSAQVTAHYTPDTLVGRSVIACFNLGEKILQGLSRNSYSLGLLTRREEYAWPRLIQKFPMDKSCTKCAKYCETNIVLSMYHNYLPNKSDTIMLAISFRRGQARTPGC